MRRIPVIVAAISAIGAAAGNASAGPMTALPIPIERPILSVAYTELIVDNTYGYANLRDRPSTSGKIVARLARGTTVLVMGKTRSGSWFHVRTGDRTGYIKANLLKAPGAPQPATAGVPQPATAGATTSSNAVPSTGLQVASTNGFRDGKYPGPSVNAYYGLVRVEAEIQGGRITSVSVLRYPSDRSTSRYINSRALPVLESEVVSAQSARVDIVTGATLTSTAYIRSLQSALSQAR